LKFWVGVENLQSWERGA